FRERRRRARRRRRIRRALVAGLLAGAGAALALGATYIGKSGGASSSRPPGATPARKAPLQRPVPKEIRGVHVTMGLASLPGRIYDYLALRAYGLNTIELDVKDEDGKIGFVSPDLPTLVAKIGAAGAYYDPRKLAALVHARGIYLIGRVVVFEDPTLAAARPDMALERTDGSVWTNASGLGWANEYDVRVWRYDVDVAVAAARAGFDEIQFDYVRFPSDGDLSQIVYAGERKEPKGDTITRFLRYAAGRLHPLHVRVSADLFGLAATHDLGIGQVPQRLVGTLDAIYPMVYPSHFGAGEYRLADPSEYPGRTVAHALHDFRIAVHAKVRLVPWLQDFTLGKPYGLIEVTDQIAAARRQHAGGFLLWNPEGVYTQDALSADG